MNKLLVATKSFTEFTAAVAEATAAGLDVVIPPGDQAEHYRAYIEVDDVEASE